MEWLFAGFAALAAILSAVNVALAMEERNHLRRRTAMTKQATAALPQDGILTDEHH